MSNVVNIAEVDSFEKRYNDAVVTDNTRLAAKLLHLWVKDLVEFDSAIAKIANRAEEYRVLASEMRDPDARQSMLNLAELFEMQLRSQRTLIVKRMRKRI